MRILYSLYIVGAEKAIRTENQNDRQHREGCWHTVLAAQIGACNGFQPPYEYTGNQSTNDAVEPSNNHYHQNTQADGAKLWAQSTGCRHQNARQRSSERTKHPGQIKHPAHVDTHGVSGGLIRSGSAQRNATPGKAEIQQVNDEHCCTDEKAVGKI